MPDELRKFPRVGGIARDRRFARPDHQVAEPLVVRGADQPVLQCPRVLVRVMPGHRSEPTPPNQPLRLLVSESGRGPPRGAQEDTCGGGFDVRNASDCFEQMSHLLGCPRTTGDTTERGPNDEGPVQLAPGGSALSDSELGTDLLSSGRGSDSAVPWLSPPSSRAPAVSLASGSPNQPRPHP